MGQCTAPASPSTPAWFRSLLKAWPLRLPPVRRFACLWFSVPHTIRSWTRRGWRRGRRTGAVGAPLYYSAFCGGFRASCLLAKTRLWRAWLAKLGAEERTRGTGRAGDAASFGASGTLTYLLPGPFFGVRGGSKPSRGLDIVRAAFRRAWRSVNGAVAYRPLLAHRATLRFGGLPATAAAGVSNACHAPRAAHTYGSAGAV